MAAKKILIVDYEKKSIDLLSDIFSPYNLQIIAATDGQKAYELYVEEKPDVLILEPMLPKLHGFELAKKIREESDVNTPIVIVTALYKGAQHRNEAKKSFGVTEYFEKPFDQEALVNSVLNIIYDEEPIDEDLPDPEDIIKTLSELADGLPEDENK